MPNYTEVAREARKKVLELIYKAQTSHIGSNFSAIDIMAVLFDKVDPKKDEVILSAGWKAAAWYYFLWKKGIITEEELNSYCGLCDKCLGTGYWEFHGQRNTQCPKCDGNKRSKFIGLVEPMNRWGLRFAGGSMGYGLPAAVGFALSKKLKGEEGKVYCLMSDGEMQCGTTWESALIAAHHKLDNLVVIVDDNKFQAMGKTNEILNIENLDWKWVAFNWNFVKIPVGNNPEHIELAMKFEEDKKSETIGKPLIYLCHTIKGKGWKRAEHNNNYHYKAPSKEEYEEAVIELNNA